MSKWLTKKTIGIIVFSSVIAIMGTRAICNSLQDTRNLQLQNNEVVLEYGSELVLDPKLYIKDLLDENIGTEVYRVKEDTYEKVDDVSLLDVGVYALVFTYGEEILEMKIYVVDTQAPIISLKQKEVVLNYGSEWKVEDYVESVRDVIDGELEYTIEGDVDSTSVATYMIKVIASDKHGLIAEDCIQVVVKKKEESKSNKKEDKVKINPEDGKVDEDYDPFAGVMDKGDDTEKELKPWSVDEVPLERRGDGGLAFASKDEARKWANQQIYDESSKWFGYKYMLSQIQKYGQKRLDNDPWAVTFIPVN